MADEEQGGDGMFDSARRMANSVLGLVHDRISLAAIELQEEKLRAISLLIWLCVAMALGVAGLLVAIGALALFLWQQAGYAGLIGLALVAISAGGVVLWLLRRRILTGPQPFADTVAEFGKDFECLRPRQ